MAEEKLDDKVKAKTGYQTSQLLKAPLEPPTPKDKRPPKEKQKSGLIVGFVVILIGLVVWPLTGLRGTLIILVLGALLIVISTLIRL